MSCFTSPLTCLGTQTLHCEIRLKNFSIPFDSCIPKIFELSPPIKYKGPKINIFSLANQTCCNFAPLDTISCGSVVVMPTWVIIPSLSQKSQLKISLSLYLSKGKVLFFLQNCTQRKT